MLERPGAADVFRFGDIGNGCARGERSSDREQASLSRRSAPVAGVCGSLVVAEQANSRLVAIIG